MNEIKGCSSVSRLTFLLVTSYFLLVTRCFLLVTRYFLLVIRYFYSLLVVVFPLATHCFFTHYILLVTRSLLLVTFPLVTHCFFTYQILLVTFYLPLIKLLSKMSTVNTAGISLNVRFFHAKISSDLRSCIKLFYFKYSMEWI